IRVLGPAARAGLGPRPSSSRLVSADGPARLRPPMGGPGWGLGLGGRSRARQNEATGAARRTHQLAAGGAAGEAGSHDPPGAPGMDADRRLLERQQRVLAAAR